MAYTKDDVKYVRLDSVDVWASSEGNIHITSRDPDAKKLHTFVTNNPDSVRYHPTMYKQFARILTSFGKDVPGWDPAEAPNIKE